MVVVGKGHRERERESEKGENQKLVIDRPNSLASSHCDLPQNAKKKERENGRVNKTTLMKKRRDRESVGVSGDEG